MRVSFPDTVRVTGVWSCGSHSKPFEEMWSSENQREEGGFSGGDRILGFWRPRQNRCRKFAETERWVVGSLWKWRMGRWKVLGGTVRRGIYVTLVGHVFIRAVLRDKCKLREGRLPVGNVEARAPAERSGGCALLLPLQPGGTCLCLLALNVLILRDLSLFQQIKKDLKKYSKIF